MHECIIAAVRAKSDLILITPQHLGTIVSRSQWVQFSRVMEQDVGASSRLYPFFKSWKVTTNIRHDHFSVALLLLSIVQNQGQQPNLNGKNAIPTHILINAYCIYLLLLNTRKKTQNINLAQLTLDYNYQILR